VTAVLGLVLGVPSPVPHRPLMSVPGCQLLFPALRFFLFLWSTHVLCSYLSAPFFSPELVF
jgi:hypothetical protein